MTRCLMAFLMSSLILIAGTTSLASAGAFDSLRDDYIAEGAGHYSALEAARAVLEGKAQSEWTALELQTYLNESLWTVYCGAIAHKFDQDVLPFTMSQLTIGEYMAGWPANPLNDWEPIEILDIADGFSPGDLVLQVAPPEAWSIGGRLVHTERPMSFELGIYGPDLQSTQFSSAHPDELNTWAVVPDGTLFMIGTFRETTAQTLAKREDRIDSGAGTD